ncbi:hypothetical protein [Natrarchaeobaculum sulfurireducens]|uniref:hypothetical protein n=1 Tax=Natrarchaeobaculum sulfurireducens TaxID=2044521 RepID=UPI00137A201D|nr:hypothetical protein [Natrarchaeobaculum sulfurireducens]
MVGESAAGSLESGLEVALVAEQQRPSAPARPIDEIVCVREAGHQILVIAGVGITLERERYVNRTSLLL